MKIYFSTVTDRHSGEYVELKQLARIASAELISGCPADDDNILVFKDEL